MDKPDEAKSIEIDALTEAGNIGAGHAATSLSKVLNDRIMNKSTHSKIVPLHSVPEALGGAEKVFAGIYASFGGDLTGSIMMLFPDKSVRMMANVLCGSEIQGYKLGQDHESMLAEVGNICLCWYLSAVSKLIGIDIIPNLPMLAYDMVGAIIDYPLIELGKVADSALLIATEFTGEVNEIEGIFLMLPEPESQKIMARKLGVG